jgi:hypothetical protein
VQLRRGPRCCLDRLSCRHGALSNTGRLPEARGSLVEACEPAFFSHVTRVLMAAALPTQTHARVCPGKLSSVATLAFAANRAATRRPQLVMGCS